MPQKGLDLIKPVPQSVQLLEKNLKHADHKVRDNWVGDLPLSKPPAEPLVDMCSERLMYHENWYVRRVGASALVKAVTDIRGAPPLATAWASKHLEDQDPEVRRRSGQYLESISKISDDMIAEAAAVVEYKPEDADQLKAYEARKAKEQAKIDLIATTAADGANEAAGKLTHDDPRVRQTAVETLSRMGCRAEPHADAIAALLIDEDCEVRYEVVRAIRRLGVFMAGAALTMGDFLAVGDEVLRKHTTYAIKTLASSSGPAAAAGVAIQLRHPDKETRMAALKAMQELGPLAAPHGDMIAERLDEEDKVLRFAAGRALACAGPAVAPSVKTVAAHLDNPAQDIHRTAIDAMKGLAPIIGAVARSQGKVLREDPEDAGELAMRQRKAAMAILGAAQKYAAPYLEDVGQEMESRDWTIRRASADCFEALGAFAEGKGAKEVSRRLLHEDPNVRRVAAETLGRMGKHAGDYAYDVATMLESEEDPDARNAAVAACKKLQNAGVLEGDIPEAQSPTLRRARSSGGLSASSPKRGGSSRGGSRGKRR